MTKLTRKTFTTKDTKGCEFTAEGFYEKEAWERKSNAVMYKGMGFETKTLEELQEKVGKL